MYICITGSKNNKDVYIKQSYRKDNGKTSSRIYKKLGKYNDLLEQFSGWGKNSGINQLCKDGMKIIVEFMAGTNVSADVIQS